ncbi:hypothetical protein H310_08470 [Aphanomyces invadans]|uniref:WRKY19-like zinc finger domain-containing protein n=1 Tax=Aphanomyces invadans TaxID=157072 RepID=A0A024TYB4_9STRA|nr:hypothetical protein H310_08470 [Aphanomyces invadans]ETV98998.1 hypothetical protein H310_08470 [Aphanomyces invadans]|eukprot:XP_008872426.1 hypothetical protein H310_08470 [Aphanomyces invadans]
MSLAHHPRQHVSSDVLPPLHAWLPSANPFFPVPLQHVSYATYAHDGGLVHPPPQEQPHVRSFAGPSHNLRRLPSLSNILNPITSTVAPVTIPTYSHGQQYTTMPNFVGNVALEAPNLTPSPTTSTAASTHTVDGLDDDHHHQSPHVIPEVPGQCLEAQCNEPVKHRGFCKRHGGARRCSVPHCTKGVQGGSLCIGHGGGKRCRIPDCNKATQSQGLCKAHGGGVRCKFDGCNKSSQGGGFCRRHGGGKRCSVEGCPRGAQRGATCAQHGGKTRCLVADCVRADRGGGFCEVHRRGKVCTLSYCNRLAKVQCDGYCAQHHRERQLAYQK